MAAFPRPTLPSEFVGLTINPAIIRQGGRLQAGQPLYVPLTGLQRAVAGIIDPRRMTYGTMAQTPTTARAGTV